MTFVLHYFCSVVLHYFHFEGLWSTQIKINTLYKYTIRFVTYGYGYALFSVFFRDSPPQSLQWNLLLYDLQHRSILYARQSCRILMYSRGTYLARIPYLLRYPHKKGNSHRIGKSLFTQWKAANGRADPRCHGH